MNRQEQGVEFDPKRDLKVAVNLMGILGVPNELLRGGHGFRYLTQLPKFLGLFPVLLAGLMVPPDPWGRQGYDPACFYAFLGFLALYLVRVAAAQRNRGVRHGFDVGDVRPFREFAVGLALALLAGAVSPPLGTVLVVSNFCNAFSMKAAEARNKLAAWAMIDAEIEGRNLADELRRQRGD